MENKDTTNLYDWLKAYAEHGGKIPLEQVLEDIDTHSSFKALAAYKPPAVEEIARITRIIYDFDGGFFCMPWAKAVEIATAIHALGEGGK
jgi:hypothetical protein